MLSHRSAPARQSLGSFVGSQPVDFEDGAQRTAALRRIAKPLYVVRTERGLRAAHEGSVQIGANPGSDPWLDVVEAPPSRGEALVGWCGAAELRDLGDPAFSAQFGLRANYLVGAMANGIASVELVQASARAGLLAFFGAGGLSFGDVNAAIDELDSSLIGAPWGANLIHSPAEPALEDAVARLYVERDVRCISASAYMRLTLPIVRCRLAGITAGPDGEPICRREVFGKISRVEVASQFWAPAPAAMVDQLRSEGTLDDRQAELASRVPVARDLTVEADSGGHTDNRPAITLLPTIAALRGRLQQQFSSGEPLRFGAAGGLSTPAAILAAFELGAAFVLTGSVNQACLEAGTSDRVRQMLAEAEQADTAMAPAADMFETGVKLQVLKRGTLFASRAQRLYDLYRAHGSLDEIDQRQREKLERTVFRQSIAEVWRATSEFWQERDPAQLERAARDPKHRMALTFRWYLGLSSLWANRGVEDRQGDYQVWCGPAMGAFNEWTRDSFLADWRERDVVTVALNLMAGAAALRRARALQHQGLDFHVDIEPLPRTELEALLA